MARGRRQGQTALLPCWTLLRSILTGLLRSSSTQLRTESTRYDGEVNVAEVTGLTAARTQEIVDASVVSGSVDGSGHLILHTHDGGTVDAGDVIGPQGDPGPTGPVSPAPTGSVIMFGSVTPPSGWVVCNGAAISRTTQAAL